LIEFDNAFANYLGFRTKLKRVKRRMFHTFWWFER